MQPQTAPAPNPTLIFETFNAYHRSAALKGGIDLEVFTAIAEGNSTAEQLATRCHADPRGMRMLCDALVIYELLTKSGDHYALTPESATFLDRRSPAYMGGTAGFLCHPEHARAWEDVAAAVRKGGTTLGQDGYVKIENQLWVSFAQGMGAMAMPTAKRIAGLLQESGAQPTRVLDVAAGHGVYGICVAQAYPQAEITALDWADVLAVAKENAVKMGVGSRYQTIEGSFFDHDLGSNYDVVLLTNFLHHFDRKTCVGIISKAKAALKPGGKIVTVEFVPNDDRVSPASADFALTMLVATPGGDAYTFSELSTMFREAGVSNTVRHEIAPGHPQIILVSS